MQKLPFRSSCAEQSQRQNIQPKMEGDQVRLCSHRPATRRLARHVLNQHVILFNIFLFNCLVVLTGHVSPHRRTYKYSLLEPYLSSEPCSHSIFSSRCTSTSECAPPGVSHAPCLTSAFRSGARGFGVSCGTAQCMQSARAGFSCGVEGGGALLRRTSGC